MVDRQQDPRGSDGAPEEEPEVAQPSAGEREELIPTEAGNAVERTAPSDFASLRVMPVLSLDPSRALRRYQEDWAKVMRSHVLASNALRPVSLMLRRYQ